MRCSRKTVHRVLLKCIRSPATLHVMAVQGGEGLLSLAEQVAAFQASPRTSMARQPPRATQLTLAVVRAPAAPPLRQ